MSATRRKVTSLLVAATLFAMLATARWLPGWAPPGESAKPSETDSPEATASNSEATGSSIPRGVYYYKYPSVSRAQTFNLSADIQSVIQPSSPALNASQTASVNAAYTVTATRNLAADKTTTQNFVIQVAMTVCVATDTADAQTYIADFIDPQADGNANKYGMTSVMAFYAERLYTGLTWEQMSPTSIAPITQTSSVSDTSASSTSFTVGTTTSASYSSTDTVTNSVTDWVILGNKSDNQIAWDYHINSPYQYPDSPEVTMDSILELPALSLVGGTLNASAVLETTGVPDSITFQPFIEMSMALMALGGNPSYERYDLGDTGGPSGPFTLPLITIDLTKVPVPSQSPD